MARGEATRRRKKNQELAQVLKGKVRDFRALHEACKRRQCTR